MLTNGYDFGFAVLRHTIGLKYSRHFHTRATFIVIQSEVKPEPIVTRRTRFPALHVSYMYSLVIGHSDNLSFFVLRHSIENHFCEVQGVYYGKVYPPINTAHLFLWNIVLISQTKHFTDRQAKNLSSRTGPYSFLNGRNTPVSFSQESNCLFKLRKKLPACCILHFRRDGTAKIKFVIRRGTRGQLTHWRPWKYVHK